MKAGIRPEYISHSIGVAPLPLDTLIIYSRIPSLDHPEVTTPQGLRKVDPGYVEEQEYRERIIRRGTPLHEHGLNKSNPGIVPPVQNLRKALQIG